MCVFWPYCVKTTLFVQSLYKNKNKNEASIKKIIKHATKFIIYISLREGEMSMKKNSGYSLWRLRWWCKEPCLFLSSRCAWEELRSTVDMRNNKICARNTKWRKAGSAGINSVFQYRRSVAFCKRIRSVRLHWVLGTKHHLQVARWLHNGST